jgi:hypothetical protein
MFRRATVGAITIALALVANPAASHAKTKKPTPRPVAGQPCAVAYSVALDNADARLWCGPVGTALAWQQVALPYRDVAANTSALSAFPRLGSTNRNFIPVAFLSPQSDLELWGIAAVYGWARPDAFSGYGTTVITDPTGTNFFTIFKGLGFSLELKPGLVTNTAEQQAFLASYEPDGGVTLLGGSLPAITWNVEGNGFDYSAFIVGSHFIVLTTLPDETLGTINQILAANGQAILPYLDGPTA